jgi:hypothetical protein
VRLSTHRCSRRSAEEDLAASRRQAAVALAAGRARAGRSGRVGDIAYLEDDGTLLSPDGQWLLAPASRRFFAEVAADAFDFVSFFPQTGPDGGAFHLLIRNSDRGIGKPVVDHRAAYGAPSRLQSVHLFYPLPALPENPTERLPENNDSVLSLIAQEVGHRWGASVRFRDPAGRLSGDLLGRDGSHWSFFLDSGASALEGNCWEAHGGYHWSLRPTDGYSPLDQYLMGVRVPEEVPPLRLLRRARDPEGRSWKASDRPKTGVRLQAEVEEIPLKAIVAAEGSRDPAPRAGQAFRHAFVLLLRRHEGLLGARLRQLDAIRGSWEAYFSRATEGRATLRMAL